MQKGLEEDHLCVDAPSRTWYAADRTSPSSGACPEPAHLGSGCVRHAVAQLLAFVSPKPEERQERERVMMRFAIFVLIMLVLVPSARPAAPLYSVCSRDDQLREVDPATGATLGSSAITVSGHTVNIGHGLAAHPVDGTLYALLRLDDVWGDRWLATIDPSTREAVLIGCTGEYIAAIAFDAAGTLWGVAGNNAEIHGALYEISTADASVEFQRFLGRGYCGVGLAMNPDDGGLLYHAAGGYYSPTVFEKIVDFNAVTYEDIPIGSPLTDYATEALTYWPAGSVFVWASNWEEPHDFYHVTSSGAGTYVAALDHKAKGLAFCSGNLYSVCRNDDQLRRVDPATGATLSSITMTLAGATIDDGAAGLATHPTYGNLWALLGTDLYSYRTLVTVDHTTGVCTLIGNAEDWFSGIAFDGTGTLWGICGDGADDPEALYIIDPSDASIEFFAGLGRGEDSESIAYNPDDGRLYHVSGYGSNSIFERIIFTGTYNGTEPIPIGSPLTDECMQALTYWQDEDVFLWALNYEEPHGLYRVASNGAATYVGQLDHKTRGLAFHEALQAVQETSWGRIKNLYR